MMYHKLVGMAALLLAALLIGACTSDFARTNDPQTTPVPDNQPERLTPLPSPIAQKYTAIAGSVGTPGPGVDGELPDPEEVIVTVHDIDYNLNEHLAENVSVRGTVGEVISNNAFVLEDPTPLTGEVLVIYEDIDTDIAIQEGDSVIVTGSVSQFDPENLEGTSGVTLDIPRALHGDYLGEPTIIATGITSAPAAINE
jgi:uncharacterized protein YdeI (BOF family)